MAPKKQSEKDQTTLEILPRRSPRISVNSSPSEPPKKKPKTTPKTPKPKPEPEAKPEPEPVVVVTEAGGGSKKTIIVEHCKQCNSFKTRAVQVKKGLEVVVGVNVVVNPEKPRKGCFEIRDESGETFVSLLDMKRPFKAMKELDMEKVILDIVQKIK